MLTLKTKRSGGIPVTIQVHRLISRGNAARGVADWPKAADAYEAALRLDADLAHIWVQLGHAAAEAGQWDRADAAYVRALDCGASPAEVYLHRGHQCKRSGARPRALLYYARAAEAGSGDAAAELMASARLLHSSVGSAPVLRLARSGRLSELAAIAATGSFRPGTGGSEGKGLIYDISDLVAHFRHYRSPTGIQRVQIEVIGRSLNVSGSQTRVCCFVEGMAFLVEVPMSLFLDLVRLAKDGSRADDSEWIEAVTCLFLVVAFSDAMEFAERDCLVNLGTSWWIYNYFLYIRSLKARYNITLLTMVYDLIPVYAPEHCVRGVAEDYVTWLVGATQHTDHFLAISKSTGRDLERAARRLGHGDIGSRITVVPLDADFRTGTTGQKSDILDRHGLRAGAYAVIVSTIESRKNHILALEAWSALVRSPDLPNCPQLVFVGRNGWLNDQVFARLSADPDLGRRVTVIERASDSELADVYRHSLFTVYPSHYEGWGLPVTESLCYGKVPVVADNSSLPEAGGEFALMFTSDSVSALTAAVRKVLLDPAWREERESFIREHFAPRSWQAIAEQILDQAIALTAKVGTGWRPPQASLGDYYPVRLHKSLRLWDGLASGEMFRFGTGWHWPDQNGCRIKPEGAQLAFRLPEGLDQVRLYVQLIGLSSQESSYHIRVDGQEIGRGVLQPGTTRWSTAATIMVGERNHINIDIVGGMAEPLLMQEGGTAYPRIASIGVAGFFMCGEQLDAEWFTFLEAAAGGNLEDLDAFRDRSIAMASELVTEAQI